MNPYPIDEKFKSFGFEVINIDGNDIVQIMAAFEKARRTKGKIIRDRDKDSTW